MKINKIHNQYQNIKQYQLNENQKKNDEIKKEKSVDIEISKSAKELAQKINETKSVEYSKRVEKIRASILDGTYKVDSEKIAEKILEKMNTQKGSDD